MDEGGARPPGSRPRSPASPRREAVDRRSEPDRGSPGRPVRLASLAQGGGQSSAREAGWAEGVVSASDRGSMRAAGIARPTRSTRFARSGRRAELGRFMGSVPGPTGDGGGMGGGVPFGRGRARTAEGWEGASPSPPGGGKGIEGMRGGSDGYPGEESARRSAQPPVGGRGRRRVPVRWRRRCECLLSLAEALAGGVSGKGIEGMRGGSDRYPGEESARRSAQAPVGGRGWGRVPVRWRRRCECLPSLAEAFFGGVSWK